MKNQRGFTIVEVLIAVLVLSIGVLGLASTAAVVTRMVAQGDRYSQASAMATQRLEVLRSQKCAAMSNGSATSEGMQVSWTVTSIMSGAARRVQITVVSPTGRGTRTDTFYNTLVC